MILHNFSVPVLLSTVFGMTLLSCQNNKPEPIYPQKEVLISHSESIKTANIIQDETATEVADGLELTLWASDTLVKDPIAIDVDENGRVYYTRAIRPGHSEFDIRGHRNWMTASISFETVEDRRKFLRETFTDGSEESEKHLKDLNNDGVRDWRDLTVEKEQVWFVEDADNIGVANRSQLFIEDFHEEITDVANGIAIHDGEVFISVAPDVWKTKDTDEDGIADLKQSISHGYAVHIGFGGHGMSGVTIGPAGRLWWGIGDIGANIIDQEGKQWKYPNQGVIARSEPDGSNFEIFAAGLRNTHEFVFDKYGNLISEDNDGDHRGERERLVYLIDGSDSGWRINWQFGKYTDPKNNQYKVWMDENMHQPRWEGQAAYFLPPITNYVNGPTGLAYNPGTALGEKWYDHFFIAEFRGTPARSPLHAFTLKPKGASFELSSTQEVAKGLLPTGIDFGPDGALYFSDWIDGWEPNNKGRIWKLDTHNAEESEIRKETKTLIQSDFSQKDLDELENLLGHQDMRVRQKSQFELVKRGDDGFNVFNRCISQSESQIARIHSIWGISQFARVDKDFASALVPLLRDNDPEICAQAAKMIGDVRYPRAGDVLISLLKHPNIRVQFFATEALGRTMNKKAIQPILDMLEKNNDEDTWLRHCGAIALSRIGDPQPLVNLAHHESEALRIVAVVALRRMQNSGVSQFLDDQQEYIVTEAARAINDDYSIEQSLPDLANLLIKNRFTDEALVRRAINANLRVGKADNLRTLTKYTTNKTAPPEMRAEALAALSTWHEPSVFDRVDGRYRGQVSRDAQLVITSLAPIINSLLTEKHPSIQVEAANAIAALEISNAESNLIKLIQESPNINVRKASLKALNKIHSKLLNKALDIALEDKSPEVRSTALQILPGSNISNENFSQLFEKILASGTVEEKQAVLASLSSISGFNAEKVLSKPFDQLISGKAPPEIQLDILQAVEKLDAPALNQKLETYYKSKDSSNVVNLYREALEGGNPRSGRNIFYNHEGAQCIRCHAVFEVGGNVGPGLAGIGDKLSRVELLESIVEPSKRIAPGFGNLSVVTDNGNKISGILVDESATEVKIKSGNEKIKTVKKEDIQERENMPSGMPDITSILSKSEIRDLVAFLVNLKSEKD